MQERRRAIVAWSGAVCAGAGVLAVFAQHVPWLLIPAVVLAVLAFGILLAAGIPDLAGWVRDRKRPAPPAEEPQHAILPALRTLAVEGRSLQGRITDRGPMVGMPPGLPDRVEGWERTVRTALQSRPELCAQFEAAANPGARFVILQSATDDLYRRLESHLGVLEAIVRRLAGPGGEG